MVSKIAERQGSTLYSLVRTSARSGIWLTKECLIEQIQSAIDEAGKEKDERIRELENKIARFEKQADERWEAAQ